MYIYNVTINIENSAHDTWLEWMLDTRKFTKALMTKVQVEEEMGGTTYSVQYHTDSKATLDKYYAEDAEKLRAQGKHFEGKFVAFRTELEIICEQ